MSQAAHHNDGGVGPKPSMQGGVLPSQQKRTQNFFNGGPFGGGNQQSQQRPFFNNSGPSNGGGRPFGNVFQAPTSKPKQDGSNGSAHDSNNSGSFLQRSQFMAPMRVNNGHQGMRSQGPPPQGFAGSPGSQSVRSNMSSNDSNSESEFSMDDNQTSPLKIEQPDQPTAFTHLPSPGHSPISRDENMQQREMPIPSGKLVFDGGSSPGGNGKPQRPASADQVTMNAMNMRIPENNGIKRPQSAMMIRSNNSYSNQQPMQQPMKQPMENQEIYQQDQNQQPEDNRPMMHAPSNVHAPPSAMHPPQPTMHAPSINGNDTVRSRPPVMTRRPSPSVLQSNMVVRSPASKRRPSGPMQPNNMLPQQSAHQQVGFVNNMSMGFPNDASSSEDPTMLMMAFAKIMGHNRDEQSRKITDLSAELTASREFISILEERSDQLNETSSGLQNQHNDLKNLFAKLAKEVEDVTESCKTYEIQRKEFEKVVRDLQVAKDKVIKESEQSKLNEATAEAARADALANLTAAREEVKALTAEVAQLQSTLASKEAHIEKHLAEILQLQQELEKLRESHTALQESTRVKLEASTSEIKSLNESLDALNAAHQELRERSRADLTAAEQRFHDNIESLRAAHEAKVNQLMDRNATITDNMNKAHSDRMADMINSQAEERKSAIANHTREMETLRQLHNARSEELISRIKNLEIDLSASAEKLLRAIERGDEAVSNGKNLEFLVSEREKNIASLQSEIAEFRRIREMELVEWRAKKEELTGELNEKTQSIAQLSAEINTLKDDAINNQKEIKIRDEGLAEANSVIEKVSLQLNELSSTLTDRDSMIEELEKKINAQLDEIKEAKEDATNAEKELTSMIERFTSAESDSMSFATLNNDLRKEVDRLKKELNAMRKAESEASSKIASAEVEKKGAAKEIQSLKNQIEEIACQVAEEKEKVKALETKNVELTSTLKQREKELSLATEKEKQTVAQMKDFMKRREFELMHEMNTKNQKGGEDHAKLRSLENELNRLKQLDLEQKQLIAELKARPAEHIPRSTQKNTPHSSALEIKTTSKTPSAHTSKTGATPSSSLKHRISDTKSSATPSSRHVDGIFGNRQPTPPLGKVLAASTQSVSRNVPPTPRIFSKMAAEDDDDEYALDRNIDDILANVSVDEEQSASQGYVPNSQMSYKKKPKSSNRKEKTSSKQSIPSLGKAPAATQGKRKTIVDYDEDELSEPQDVPAPAQKRSRKGKISTSSANQKTTVEISGKATSRNASRSAKAPPPPPPARDAGPDAFEFIESNTIGVNMNKRQMPKANSRASDNGGSRRRQLPVLTEDSPADDDSNLFALFGGM
ncbi:hypothetical protein HDV05_002242 [Chytridiales sp. JEL 0842]|nr:hypothetical protein HDV05_002242 [Chytridiales sp. JEL 0842]